jgi:hypothetical protein
MSDTEYLAKRSQVEEKLAATRRELLDLFGSPADGGSGRGSRRQRDRQMGGFPRSRTMRLLLSSRGLGALAVTACGFLVSRPALALRLLRLVPLGTVARILAFRFFSAQGSKV